MTRRATSLLPPNATALERRLADTNARISDIPVDIGALMDPDAIPLRFLPWLAWHLGVETWKDYWPEQVKRARVKAAAAVREVCASFGANVAMREWFEKTPKGRPGTFEILMTVGARDGIPATGGVDASALLAKFKCRFLDPSSVGRLPVRPCRRRCTE
ncbi:phage tail protein I [Burkholderia pseudomallei]|uniref:phage tail protein I n=1 Tax=Burkholderia pseudomallei TaxID=28450 RepID=UPI0031335622